jgi:hypothetical protein
VTAGLLLERRYGISPAALAFGVHVLADHSVRAAVADLGWQFGRLPSPPERALDFEQERVLRLLAGPADRVAAGATPDPGGSRLPSGAPGGTDRRVGGVGPSRPVQVGLQVDHIRLWHDGTHPSFRLVDARHHLGR